MKRIESFFLPDDDFVPDEEMIQAIGEVTSADSAGANMLPSDRVLKEIRSKEVQRGQFGIGNIFWIITALSFVCAAPNLFGFNTARYWMNVALFAWIFAPGWTYLSWWAVNSYEFSPAFHVMTGLLVVSIAGILFFYQGILDLYCGDPLAAAVSAYVLAAFLVQKRECQIKEY